MNSLKVARMAVLYAALAALAGWGLGFLGLLKPWPYVLLMTLGLTLGFSWLWMEGNRKKILFKLGVHSRYYKKLLPASFLLLALLALAGGLLYTPANFDGLTYRGSRVLHWISDGGWHWIHSSNGRMNTRGTVFEWMSIPFFMLLKSDRLLFLLNWTAFLLLPGLCFRFFRLCGLAARTSWWWMWLVPMGYGYALQAGSIGNDAIACVFFLSSLIWLLPSRVKVVQPSDIVFSLLAIGLTTGVKATNLVLGLPWLYLFCCQWKVIFRYKVLVFCAGFLGLVVSFVPTAALNHLYCGDWSGMAAEGNDIAIKSPLMGFIGNGFLLASQNFQPFVMPMAAKFTGVLDQILPSAIKAQYNPGAFGFSELQMEESAGLGMAVCLVLILALVLGAGRPRLSIRGWVLSGLGVAAVLVFAVTSALTTPARMLLSCYPLLLLPCLACLSPSFGRSWVWKLGVCLVPITACLVVILTPPRPLFPVPLLNRVVKVIGVSDTLTGRVEKVYHVYGNRGRSFEPLLNRIPSDVAVLGFYATGDAPETALWRPFGQRKIVHILEGDSPADLQDKSVHMAVVSDYAMYLKGITLNEWLGTYGGRVVDSVLLELKASQSSELWYVVAWP